MSFSIALQKEGFATKKKKRVTQFHFWVTLFCMEMNKKM